LFAKYWKSTTGCLQHKPQTALQKHPLLLHLVWHAPLRVRSVKGRHQSPAWTILSHIDCLIQGEIVGFQGATKLLKPLNNYLLLVTWTGLWSVLRPRQHSIGYMGYGFYRSKDPSNSIIIIIIIIIKQEHD